VKRFADFVSAILVLNEHYEDHVLVYRYFDDLKL